MKKTYSNPMVKAIDINSEELICVSLSDEAANGTPAGVKRRNKMNAEDFYTEGEPEEEFEEE